MCKGECIVLLLLQPASSVCFGEGEEVVAGTGEGVLYALGFENNSRYTQL